MEFGMITPEEAARDLYKALIEEVEGKIFTDIGKFEDGETCLVVYVDDLALKGMPVLPPKWLDYWVVVEQIDLEDLFAEIEYVVGTDRNF